MIYDFLPLICFIYCYISNYIINGGASAIPHQHPDGQIITKKSPAATPNPNRQPRLLRFSRASGLSTARINGLSHDNKKANGFRHSEEESQCQYI